MAFAAARSSVWAMQRAISDGARPKVAAIQALRAIAALTVAAIHLTDAFAQHIDARLTGFPRGEQLAQVAVALFFVISGCVMVLSSGKLFGWAGGAAVFWRRRAVRVLPPYWIATGLLVAAMLALGYAVDPDYVARSLVFAGRPAGEGAGVPFALYLWPGWSLFYELLFYALFGAFVAFGRTAAVALTALALGGMVVAGQMAAPAGMVAYAATRPVVLLFVAGMGFGLLFERGWSAPRWARALAVLAAAALIVFAARPQAALGFGYLAWAGAPAVLVYWAIASGRQRIPFARAFARLGDASYAIYLLHVPFAHLWMRVFNVWWRHPGGSIGYLALGLPLLIALSLAFHRWIERPLTDRFNRRFGDKPVAAGDLPRTLAP